MGGGGGGGGGSAEKKKCPEPTDYVRCLLSKTDESTFTCTFQNSVFKS